VHDPIPLLVRTRGGAVGSGAARRLPRPSRDGSRGRSHALPL